MSAAPSIVIVGSGLAGYTLASRIADLGHAASVTLIGEECHAPYDRPPLSKEFQLGDESAVILEPGGLRGVKFIAGRRAVAIHADRRVLELSDGQQVPWDRLVLATGTRPRALPGVDPKAGVHCLRTLDDARAIRSKLRGGARLAVIGGGPIGLELAASARQLGAPVTVIEAAPRLMSRSAPATIAAALLAHHRSCGVEVLLNAGVKAVHPGWVELTGERRIEADLVVIGIGVVANDDLARDAGIATDDGIFIDGRFRTTQPDVYAIGDVTRQRNPVSGRFERIETWSNAQGQARALAQQLCGNGGAPVAAEVPWFWSDQGTLRLQCAGLPQGDTEVCRGDPATGLLVGQWSGGRLVGVAAINAPQDFNQLRRMLNAGESVTPEAFRSSLHWQAPSHQQRQGDGGDTPIPTAQASPAAAPAPSQAAAGLEACALDAIEEGGIGSAQLPDGTRIAIYRIQGEEVFATDDKCSHGSSSLCDEGTLEGHLVECGLHLGSFDIRTGKPVAAPCTKAIRSYAAQVRDGVIWIVTEPRPLDP